MRKLIALLVPVFLGTLIWWNGWWDRWQGPTETPGLQAYVEGEYLYLSAPVGGFLTQLKVTRGQRVEAGAPLFSLDTAPDDAALKEAEQRQRAAAARAEDLRQGQRPSELAAIAARLAQTRADLNLTHKQLARHRELARKKMMQQEQIDSDKTAIARNEAKIAELQAQLDTAKLGGREAAIRAAEAESEAAVQSVAKARWSVTQKLQNAPVAGQVTEIFYYLGEWVGASRPVLSLLPPERIKIRFFIPENRLSSVRTGKSVTLACSGCKAGLSARINYIASQPEYTPPLLYNRDNRAKLVFLAEAVPAPDIAAMLHPGQPVTVHLAGTAP